ncbi:MAG: hypothetical protein CEE38_20555 [Planctomycetes bacterium B3_Pla]|nr:MAG: hypothetical protein CEE38_20555 [Planctomycetes bacterium B3_Pla]
MISKEIRDLIVYHLKHTREFAEHDHRNVFVKTMRLLRSKGFDQIRGKRVLDLGCGQRFAFALQCACEGAEVTALDVNYVAPNLLPVAFVKTIKHNGLKRALKSIFRKLAFDKLYYRRLEEVYGSPLHRYQSKIKFVIADPEDAHYPVPSGSFDLIVSNAVLEHVADVPTFVNEIKRLLAGGGYFCGRIHNFYSLSGGHNMEWAYPNDKPSKRVPPWDHLRKNRFPAWVYLNRLKPEDYQEAFSRELNIILFEATNINHDLGVAGTEGEAFYTPELAHELSQYPHELLLTRSWCILCNKT